MKKIFGIFVFSLVMLTLLLSPVHAAKKTLEVNVVNVYDNHANFVVDVMKELCDRLGYNISFTETDTSNTYHIGGIHPKLRRPTSINPSTVPYVLLEYSSDNIDYEDVYDKIRNIPAYSIVGPDLSVIKNFDDAIKDAVDDGTIATLAKKHNIPIKDVSELKKFIKEFESAHSTFVHNAWILDKDKVFALMADNKLYFDKSIDIQVPKLIATDVIDLVWQNKYNDKVGTILFGNGDICNFSFDDVEVKLGARNAVNAAKIYKDNTYIDNLGNLKKEDKILFKNVRSTCEGKYVITTNYELYDLETGELILTDVESIKSEYFHLYIHRKSTNNYELYHYNTQTKEIPSRIATNVKEFIPHSYGVEILTYSGSAYTYYPQSNQLINYPVDNLYSICYSDNFRYGVTQENHHETHIKQTVYRFDAVYRSSSIISSCTLDLTGTYYFPDSYNPDFLLDYSIGLYKCTDYAPLSYAPVGIAEVIDIISGPNCYLFRTSGKLWGAFVSGNNVIEDPFLTAISKKKTQMIINNQTMELKSNIEKANNRTMFPFRECLELMGATVIWDPIQKIAIGEYGKTTVEFPIGKNYYYINGKLHTMDVSSYISNGRTYIPIRYAAEAFGFSVEWVPGDFVDTISLSK